MENQQHVFFGEVDEYALSEFQNTLETSSGDIEILLSSGGGSVFDGIAIASLIKRYEGQTTATGIGFVASIATVILLSADNVQLDKNALLMIHNAWTIEAGEASELRKVARDLDKISNQIASVYVDQVEKAGKLINNSKEDTQAYFKNLMNRETYLTAQEALELGLIDKISEGKKKEDEDEDSYGFINSTNAKEVLANVQGKAPVHFVNQLKKFVPTMANEELNFWDKLKNAFSANPEKLDQLNTEVKAEADAKQQEAIEAAKTLLSENGFNVLSESESTEEATEAEEVVVEATATEEVEAVSEQEAVLAKEVAELKAKLKEAELKAAAPATAIKTVETKAKAKVVDSQFNDIANFFNSKK